MTEQTRPLEKPEPSRTLVLQPRVVRFKDTYASMMLQGGESVMWVAQQMGHTDWTFTARTYSRWVSIDAPEAGSLAAQKWG